MVNPDGACSERDIPSWTNPTGMAALGFISATMGLQVCQLELGIVLL